MLVLLFCGWAGVSAASPAGCASAPPLASPALLASAVLFASSPASPLLADSLAPVLADFAFLDSLGGTFNGELVVHNGERPGQFPSTIRIRTRWAVPADSGAADSLVVGAVFDSLETGATGNTVVEHHPELGRGVYLIFHSMTATGNEKRDRSGIPIPVTARFGFHTTTTTLPGKTVCLSNFPPVRVETFLRGNRLAPYHSGDTLRIESVWISPGLLPLRAELDLADVVSDTSIAHAVEGKEVRGDTTFFSLSYRLPAATAMQPDSGGPRTVPVVVFDSGCGSGRDETVQINIDNTPPNADLLVLDPLPAVTTEDSLTVSGSAPPDAAVVLVLRNLFAVGFAEPDSATHRFSTRIKLDTGANRIQIRAEDRSGNSTVLSQPAIVVTRVAAAGLQVITPYSRNGTENDIVIRDPAGIGQAAIRIFNLEGDCLWSEESAAVGSSEFGFHWSGTDRTQGERAPQGYYIVRAEWRNPDGRRRTDARGLLMRD